MNAVLKVVAILSGLAFLVLAGICIFTFLAGGAGLASVGQAVATAEATREAPANTELAPMPAIDWSCSDIVNAHDLFTEIKWQQLVSDLTGARVKWYCTISNVREDNDAWLDCGCKGVKSTRYDTSLVVVRLPAEEAGEYNIDQRVTVEGDIESVDDSMLSDLSIRLAPAKLWTGHRP